ncbi:MAG: FISUMP domain-containing protein, partial [Bacteroidales bacterium]|nr:FISUMP domain-containing protein [Bacteroidales bacterium]
DYLIANEFNYDNSSSGNKIAKSMASTTDWTISSVVGSVGNNFLSNNNSGFSALPGGQKSQYSSFTSKNLQASWWSSEDAPNTWGRMWYLYYNSSEFLYQQSWVNQGEALSVRCLRDDPKQIETAQINTKFVTAISQFTATSGGIITSDGNSEITGSGIVWSTATMPTIEINEGISSNPYGVTDFSYIIENLSPHTVYFVRAYAVNSQGIVYGNEKSFQTLSLPSAVEVETIEVSEVGIVSAKSGIRIIDDHNYPILTSGIVWGVNPNPTIDDYVGIVFEGTTLGEYESTISGLNPTTNYYVRAFAQNIGGISYGEEFTFVTKEECVDTIYDSRDSTVYNVIRMGNKCWMKENLKYLPQVFYASSYSATLPRYYVYYYIGESVMDAKSTANYSTYGVLYNWEAARFACPDGWHLSTHNDWVDLERSVCLSENCEEAFSYDVMTGGMGEFEGSALIMDTTLWVSSTITNNQYVGTSGFDALPGGYKFQTNSFSYIGTTARFWLANNYNAASSYIRYVYNPYTTIIRSTANKEYGMSVRCVKD